jgi:glutathione S-transferase
MANHGDLTLYYHPLASFCHKVLVALYENQTPFHAQLVDLADEASSKEMLSYWPVGKIPVLRDGRRGQTVAETSIIIEYLDRHYPGPVRMLPADPDQAAEVRLWDRFFDLYVSVPMQKIVGDRIRPAGSQDPYGVDEAKAALRRAYDFLETRLQSRPSTSPWAGGEAFSLADCAAAPALFYAEAVLPFSRSHSNIAAYFERLLGRASIARIIDEARPYFGFFPYRSELAPRFAATAR